MPSLRSTRSALTAGGLSTLLALDLPFVTRWAKVTASAAISWFLAVLIFPDARPVYAPITACFVALVTIRASFQDAAQRVLAVIVGIGIAYFLGTAFGLTLWTVILVVALGVLFGQLLRLPAGASNQVPISGLLIMTIGTTPGHVGERIVETLIGAGVSVAVNWLVLPPNHVKAGRTAVLDLIDQVATVLTEMAEGIGGRWQRPEAAGWLEDARSIGGNASMTREAVEFGADSLRLRPAKADATAIQNRVASAMDTIQIVEVQVRVLARTLRDTADALGDDTGTLPPIRMGGNALLSAAKAISVFGTALLGNDQAERDGAAATAAAMIENCRLILDAINEDLADMTAANLARGVHLGALVVETGRVLDELSDGVRRRDGVVITDDDPGPGASIA